MTDTLLADDDDLTKLHRAERPARPMLARVADAVYWVARYIERAEHVARSLLVNTDLLMDIGDMAPELRQRLWHSILQVTDFDASANQLEEEARLEAVADGPEKSVGEYMTLSPENPNSLISCLTKARENARSVRETISAEMWEALNKLYWFMKMDETRARFAESPTEIYQTVLDGSMLLQGLTNETMAHGQPWLFAQVGKYLERIDMTCRILETKYQVLKSMETQLEMPLRNIHWMAVLRACGSIEGYRRVYIGDMEPLRIATFIIFEPNFPRAVRYAVRHAQQSAAKIREMANPALADGADRVLGRLNAELEYGDASVILRRGLPAYLQGIRENAAQAAAATGKAYFLAS